MAIQEARVLSQPLRVRLLQAIATSPATATQLAARLDEPVAKIRYHTSILCRAGCIQPIDPDDDPGADERLYEARP